MAEKHEESLTETAQRETSEKSPMEAVKDDVSKLVHGEDVTTDEPSRARTDKS
ncbi:MAG TPA: hypothetical protein VM784_12015 [Actinomycetota bacterium]|nr:hypothetical protein [Actinomycetota bacterium]